MPRTLYVPLLDRLVDRLRPGGLLVTDNVLWDGDVVPGFSEKKRNNPEDTAAIVEYNQRMNTHPRLMTATVPLRDGVAISVETIGPSMTVDFWLQMALADAERRGLPALKPLLEGLARSTRALRDSDLNDRADVPPASSPQGRSA